MLFLSILNCSNLAHSSKQILIQKILIRNQKKVFKRKNQLQRPGALNQTNTHPKTISAFQKSFLRSMKKSNFLLKEKVLIPTLKTDFSNLKKKFLVLVQKKPSVSNGNSSL